MTMLKIEQLRTRSKIKNNVKGLLHLCNQQQQQQQKLNYTIAIWMK